MADPDTPKPATRQIPLDPIAALFAQREEAERQRALLLAEHNRLLTLEIGQMKRRVEALTAEISALTEKLAAHRAEDSEPATGEGEA